MQTQTPKYARQPTYILCLNTSFAISSYRDSASIILYIWLVTAVVFVSVFKRCWLMAGSRKNSSGVRGKVLEFFVTKRVGSCSDRQGIMFSTCPSVCVYVCVRVCACVRARA